MLSVSWYLAAGSKWGSEAISAYSKTFHFFAWTTPAIPTFIAIFIDYKAIDIDNVAGICLIGNQVKKKYLSLWLPWLINFF